MENAATPLSLTKLPVRQHSYLYIAGRSFAQGRVRHCSDNAFNFLIGIFYRQAVSDEI